MINRQTGRQKTWVLQVMKRVEMLAAIAGICFMAVCSFVPGTSCADGLGLYFDESASVVCTPDTLTSCQVYLVLETQDPVSGFQVGISADEGIIIQLLSLGDEAINVGTWPDLIVAFGGLRVPVDGRITLATFYAFAVNSGSVRIENLNIGHPCGILTENLEFSPVNIPYGGLGGAALAFGLDPCPEEHLVRGIDGNIPMIVGFGDIKVLFRGDEK